MKRTLFLLVAAAVVFSACQKDEGSATSINGLELTATVEQHNGGTATKTYLDNLQVKWSAGDQVNVFTDAATPEKLTLTLESGAGTTSGIFKSSETPTGNPQYAIYPASDDNSISGSTITFTLPATQNYVENSFDNGANVAVGSVSGGNIAYKNVCGTLKLSIKGCYTVSRIELTGKANEKLNGTFTVDASASAPVATGGTAASDDEKKITLNCGTDGVELDVSTATDFYFVVPVSAFASGFDAVVYDMAGDAYYATLSSSTANTINRSNVRVMPAAAATRLPNGYTELSYIKSNADISTYPGDGDILDDPYITTDIIPENNAGFEIKFSTPAEFVGIKSDGGNGLFGCLFGGRYTSGKYDFQLNTYSSMLDDGAKNGTIRTGNKGFPKYDYKAGLKRNIVISCSLHNGVYTNPDGETTDVTYNLNGTIYPCYIFALNQNNTPIQGSHGASIYYIRFYDGNDALSFYGIPAKDSNDVVGMYDLITGDFLVNANTTSATAAFIAGTVLQ